MTNLARDLSQDISYGLRTMRRAPAFAATAAVTLAVGLGLNAALFTVFNAFILRPIAARDPQSLYQVYWTTTSRPKRSFDRAEYETIRTQSPAFSDVLAHMGFSARIESRFGMGTVVSENYFSLLGTNALFGRLIGPGDVSSPGGDRMVVLGHGAWKRLFGGDPAVVGRKALINGQSFDIIGICRPEFTGVSDNISDFYTPMTMVGRLAPGRESHFQIVGRLSPVVTPERATLALTALARHMTERLPEKQKALQAVLESRATLHPINPQLMTALSPLIFVFGLVLVICCANVSSMLLARAMARQREIGVRLAIGASRARLIRQLVSEALLLSVLAGVISLAIAAVAAQGSQQLLLANMPASIGSMMTFAPLEIDRRVIYFVLAAATGAVLLFALAPAIQATRTSLVNALRGEFGQHFRSSGLRSFLVATQIAVCVILVVLTGILLRSGSSYRQTDVGFETQGIQYPMAPGGFDLASIKRLLLRLRLEPSVESIAAVARAPMNGSVPRLPMAAAGSEEIVEAGHNFVSPEYFEMLRLPILRGRGFTGDEARSEAAVAIISQKTAARFWPGQDPIGKAIRIVRRAAKFDQAVVVGTTKDIVGGMVFDGIDDTMVYFPTALEARDSLVPLIRFKTGKASLDTIVAAVLPERAILTMTFDDILALQVYPFKVASWVASVLGMIALLLTASAMYGVMSYVVNQRTKEIGIRVALGAAPGDVVRLFFAYCVRLAAIGLAGGLVVSFGLSMVLGKFLFMIDAFDRVAYAAGVVVVLVTGALASSIPIQRAAGISSMEAIREG